LAWTLRFLPAASKELEKLDKAAAARIVTTLKKRIATAPDPRSLGVRLKGADGSYWRWRIGDYRAVGHVDEARITIFIIRVAHRREVYR